MVQPVTFKYRAFISYSHADTSWAKWLHRGLESFHVDKDLVGRGTAMGAIPKTLRPIFRDRDEFTAGHTLGEQTLAALNASAAMVVICSPAAAKSRYVTNEIRLFKSRYPERPIIPLIVGGKPGDSKLECFPPSLKFKLDAEGQITDEPVEVLAADAREEGDGKALALAKVVAGLLDLPADEVFRRAERERRRKGRVRNGIIAVLAILAFAATSSAVYAWQQLKTNEAFLSATLQRATEIVNTAVGQAEKYGVPRKATLELLTRAEGLFDDMARLGRPTTELKFRKAWMLIQFARNYAILGDTVKQRARAEEAHRLMVELVAKRHDNPNELYTFAVALGEKAKALEAQGNLSAALKFYRDCVAIIDRLAKGAPDNAKWQRELSVTHVMVGDVLKAQGNLADALKAFKESRAIVSRLANSDPGNANLQRDLAVPYGRIGDVLKAQGKLADALKAYQDSLVINVRLAKADPSNAQWQRDLSIAHDRVGDVLKARGSLSDALKTYQDSLVIRERLAKADPSNAQSQSDLALSYNKVGGVLEAQGNLAGALKAYQDSLAIRERLAKADPSNAPWQRDLSLSYDDVGDVLKARGSLADALKAFKDSLAIRERLAKADSSNAGWQRDLTLSYARVGDVLRAQGNLAEALKAYKNGLAIANHLAEADPANTRWQHDLAFAHSRIGSVLEAQGNLAEALKAYQDDLAISDRLAKADPSNAGWQRSLSVSHYNIARILSQDDVVQALGEFRHARAITAQLKQRSPDDAQLSKDLAIIDAEIAKLEQAGADEPMVEPAQGAR